jgi:hypothetical protein
MAQSLRGQAHRAWLASLSDAGWKQVLRRPCSAAQGGQLLVSLTIIPEHVWRRFNHLNPAIADRTISSSPPLNVPLDAAANSKAVTILMPTARKSEDAVRSE